MIIAVCKRAIVHRAAYDKGKHRLGLTEKYALSEISSSSYMSPTRDSLKEVSMMKTGCGRGRARSLHP